MARIIGVTLLLLSWQQCLLSTNGETTGGNSNGWGCYFPFQYEGIMYTTCIGINHETLWCSTTEDYDIDRRWGECVAEDIAALPSFNKSTPTNVTVYQGDKARLMCYIDNLQNKKVTWQMKGKQYPLTVSTFSFLSDSSVRVEHSQASEWNLIIERAETNDSGIYQCRVTTQTALLVREIHLTVQDRVPTVTPALTLGKSPVKFVNRGDELRLQCNSTFAYKPAPGSKVVPPEVEWFRGDGNRIDSHSLNNIRVSNQVFGRIRVSTLIIEKIESADAGPYICRNTETAHAEITVRVLNVESESKKRRGTASKAPPKLSQRTRKNSSSRYFTSSLLLVLSQLFAVFST